MEQIILETERLIPRRFLQRDLQDLYEYLSDGETLKFEPYPPMNPEEVTEELAQRIDSDEMIAVELKDSHKLIGNVYPGKREFEILEIAGKVGICQGSALPEECILLERRSGKSDLEGYFCVLQIEAISI